MKLLVFIGCLFLTSGTAVAQDTPGNPNDPDAEVTISEESRLVAVTFRSNWCGPCHVLEPKINSVKPHFASQPVEFVTLDFSWGQRRGVEERAEEEGLAELYDQYKGRTGFMALVDRKTGDVFTMLTMNQSEDQIYQAIERALEITRGRDEFDL